MNVLRNELLSRQKRRQRKVKTCFSGYYTVSQFAPTTKYFNYQSFEQKKATDSLKSASGFRKIEESDELRNCSPRGNSALEDGLDSSAIHDTGTAKTSSRRDNTGSTSLEFRKILAPFQNLKREISVDHSQKKDLGAYALVNKSGENLVRFLGNRTVDCDPEDSESSSAAHKSKESSETSKNVFSSLQKRSFPEGEISCSSNEAAILIHENRIKIDGLATERRRTKGERDSLKFDKEPVRTPKQRKTSLDFSISSGKKTPRCKGRKSPKASGSSKITASEAGAFILAVTEGRGHARGEVGIAAMDPRRPHLVLCQISDNQRYDHSLAKMNVFDFVEVIVPNTFVDCLSPNRLYCEIRSRFSTVTLTSVQRRHFSETIGIDLIKQYCSPESTSVTVLLRDKFYALSAAAALVKYIEFTQNVRLAPHSLRIEYQGTQDTMIIDLDTANLLELVMCASHPETNSSHSLLGVVKHCRTKGGIRLLRANILQPPCSLDKIEARLDCVTELINNPLLLCSLEAAVSSFTNLETLLNLCMHAPQQDGLRVAEHQLKYTLLLKTTLEFLPMLNSCLQEAKSNYFKEVLQNLKDERYTTILTRILQTVFENAKTVKGSVAAHLHGCFAIKPGINSLLDVAKKTYCEIIQEISDHVTKLRETHNLPLRISFSSNKGFHIQYSLPPGHKHLKERDLPAEFILVNKCKTTFYFYTAELVALDQRSQHVLDEIKLMTNVILFELLNDIRENIGCLFNLCENIAELDVLISFAHVGSGTDYVRPKFGEELQLKDSRHPILDVIHDGEVIPNDAESRLGRNFTILTGPNQSGKSIYIRQIALLQIMAQIGCYVPAKAAVFRLTDRIFSRIAFDDSIESNASTLIVEMRDVEYLKQNLTPRSLVIIDELCRGTSVEEGTSLAFAICEEFLDSSAFIFFTTHYLFLTRLEEMYCNVINYHFETRTEVSEAGSAGVRFTHVRLPGPTRAEMYGIQVAEVTSFPRDVTSNARNIAAKLSKVRKTNRSVDKTLAKYKMSLDLRSELTKCESDADWLKVESVIRDFRALHLKLFEETELDKSSGGKISEEREKHFGKSQILSKSRRNKKRKGKKDGGECVKKKKKSAFARDVTECSSSKAPGLEEKNLLLKLAANIKNKYKRLSMRRRKKKIPRDKKC